MSWVEETVECLTIKEVVQTCIEMAQYTQLSIIEPKLSPQIIRKAAEIYKLLAYHRELFLKHMSLEVYDNAVARTLQIMQALSDMRG